MTVTLRPFTPVDEPCFDAWLEAEAAERLGVPPGPSVHALVAIQRVARRQDFSRRRADPFAIDYRGCAVGYLVLARDADALVIVDLYVSPEVRRRGIGRAALDTTLRTHTVGVSHVRLSVEQTNPIAALYRRMGFVDVESTPTHRHMQRQVRPSTPPHLAFGVSHV